MRVKATVMAPSMPLDASAVLCGEPDDGRDLVGTLGERHRHGQLALEVARLIGPIRLAIGLVGQQTQARQLSPDAPKYLAHCFDCHSLTSIA